MPEGHSIHRLANAFNRLFLGQNLRLSSPQGRFKDEAQLLAGWIFEGASAYGKHLFLRFSPPASLSEYSPCFIHIHLGLYGSWTFNFENDLVKAIGAPRRQRNLPKISECPDFETLPAGQNVRLRIIGDSGLADLTGPNQCALIDSAAMQQIIARLGPDPLNPEASAKEFVARVKKSRQNIAQLLMDQSVIAGVGNIYRAEVLFRARLHPLTSGLELSPGLIQSMWDDLVPLMHYGFMSGMIVTTQPQHRKVHSRQNKALAYQMNTPQPVKRSDAYYVYHRLNAPCRICNTLIEMTLIAGRKVYWCPSCQLRRRRKAVWINQNSAADWALKEEFNDS